MRPHRSRRRWLPLLLLASLSTAEGCAGAHTRQWAYPDGLGRISDFRKGLGRTAKARAPQVNLRVEPDTATSPSAASVRPLDATAPDA